MRVGKSSSSDRDHYRGWEDDNAALGGESALEPVMLLFESYFPFIKSPLNLARQVPACTPQEDRASSEEDVGSRGSADSVLDDSASESVGLLNP